MKRPDNLLDATIVAFLWAEWFAKQCLWVPYHLYEKYDYWSHNKKVEQDAKEAEENPPTPLSNPLDSMPIANGDAIPPRPEEDIANDFTTSND